MHPWGALPVLHSRSAETHSWLVAMNMSFINGTWTQDGSAGSRKCQTSGYSILSSALIDGTFSRREARYEDHPTIRPASTRFECGLCTRTTKLRVHLDDHRL